MRVLVACEFSGIVRSEFAKLGHDAWSCDLLETEIPGNHIVGDVLDVLDDGWDLMIAHPPCTYLSNSGVRWLHTQEGRWQKMKDGATFSRKLLNANVPMVAAENPIPHKYAVNIIGEKYTQIIQPWQFGHGEQKATCLWLRNLPPLVPTNIVTGRKQRIWKLPPTKDRWKLRSVTYKGIAEAMAMQWGGSKSGH